MRALSHPAAVVVCGRRRERFPQASVYNALADREWDTPVGPALACGGDALMRFTAVQAVGGYEASLIAGEEPDLCLRLRRAGGKIWRLGAEMTLHDAAMRRFHVREASGRLLSGGAAFARLWRALPGWRLLGWLMAWPPMSWALELAYRAFLPLRPRLQRLVRRWWRDLYKTPK